MKYDINLNSIEKEEIRDNNIFINKITLTFLKPLPTERNTKYFLNVLAPQGNAGDKL
jgi:hypothetical protein